MLYILNSCHSAAVALKAGKERTAATSRSTVSTQHLATAYSHQELWGSIQKFSTSASKVQYLNYNDGPHANTF